ncbi:MAG: hypothetical protein M3010_00420 [Candidatus Dormibacteraeota bacterium]|nr:hypothetical protein [Candidatus Dormibacteraeota bacterium]
MLRGGEGAGRGPRLDHLGGLVLAMIAGVMVPAAAVLLLSAADPVPRSCDSGQASGTSVEGALLYSSGADLWYSEGLPGRPRKLVDYAPPRRLTAAAPSPSSTAGATRSPSPSPSPSPSRQASPQPTPSSLHPPRVLAADISADRKLVAFLVLDPPFRPGSLSLLLMSPLDPPGTAPSEAWHSTSPAPVPGRAGMVRVLESGKVLFFAPLEAAAVPSPSPHPSRPPATPSPSASPSKPAAGSGSPSGSPVPHASAQPSASPSSSPGVAVVVIGPSPKPTILDEGPRSYFVTDGHSLWADARGYHLPPLQPELSSRVDGATSRVAGVRDRSVASPLAHRRLTEIVAGVAGESATHALCAAGAGVVPVAFSPDESRLALADNGATMVLDLSSGHATSRLLTGLLLAWRA